MTIKINGVEIEFDGEIDIQIRENGARVSLKPKQAEADEEVVQPAELAPIIPPVKYPWNVPVTPWYPSPSPWTPIYPSGPSTPWQPNIITTTDGTGIVGQSPYTIWCGDNLSGTISGGMTNGFVSSSYTVVANNADNVTYTVQ